jgi:hypothetical protein
MRFVNGHVLDGLVESSVLANSSPEACEVTLMWHELFRGSDEYLTVLAGLLLEAVRQLHSGECITSVPQTIPHHLGCPD